MVANFVTLKSLADQLGLVLSPAEQSPFAQDAALRGVIDGTYVELTQWQTSYLHVDVRAFLDPPGDVGLALEPTGLGARLGELIGRHDLRVGDAAFDAAYAVHALEPDRARALFTPALREALARWAEAGAVFEVTDACVALRLPVEALWVTGAFTERDVHTPDQLLANLRAAVGLAKSFDAAFRALPPSQVLAAHAEVFRAYAAAHDLTFSASPLSVRGRVGASRLTARPSVVGDRVVVAVSLAFEPELPTMIRVRPRRATDLFDRLKAGAAATPTGDADFDGAFRTTVADADAATTWLSAPVRARLLSLQSHLGDVELDQRGLSLTTRALPDPDALTALFERLAEVERDLRAAERGPAIYR